MLRKVLHGTKIESMIWVSPTTLAGRELVAGTDDWFLHTVDTTTGADRRVSLPNTAVRFPASGGRQQSGWVYPSTPELLPDGRIGMVREHFDATDDSESATEYAAVRLESPTTGSVQSLFAVPPDGTLSPINNAFAWKPDLSEAYVTVSTGLNYGCTSIDRFERPVWGPLNLHLGSSAAGWTLSDSARNRVGDACNPKAGSASVSPVTAREQVIFVATPGAVVHAQDHSTEYVVNIYETQFDAPTAQILVSNVIADADVAISPDGRLLAWNGKKPGGKWGCWILDLQTHQEIRISDGFFEDLGWSPDGRSLAALDNLDGSVTIFDVSH